MKLPEKLGVAGTLVSLSGISFGWWLFPMLLRSQIGKIKGLAPGSESREFWEKIPFPITFTVYVFNVTNAEEIQQGGTPQVEEVGPYHYEEWKEKEEVVDFEQDDSATYFAKNTYFFNKEKTAPLTGNETIIIPHPLLIGMVLAVERTKPGALGMVNKAIGVLFNKPETIFLKTTVQELLYGGIYFNCTTKDFSASAVCAVFKRETPDLEFISPAISRFSIFKMKNATRSPMKFQVNRGIVEPARVGEVLKINEKKKLNTWRGKPCNNLEGTDSTVFPPISNPQDDIVSFNAELCRSLPAKYVGPSKYKSISAYRYNASFGDMSTEPALKCLCPEETFCWKKGIMDMMKCTGEFCRQNNCKNARLGSLQRAINCILIEGLIGTQVVFFAGAPVVVSLPHFYDSHEDYINGVKGLKPDPEKHSIILDMEPNTGTPLFARKRAQFSFHLHRVNKIEITQKLRDTLLPLLWVEESIDLPDNLVAKLDKELFQIIRIVDIVKWVIALVGAAIMSGGMGLYYKRQNSLPITPTSSAGRKFGSEDYLNGKKNTATELGHTNLGYM